MVRPRRRNGATEADWEETVEVGSGKNANPQRALWKRVLVTAMLWFMIITQPLLAWVFMSNIVFNDTTASSASASSFSMARSVAADYMETWLGKNPQPLPGGRLVSIDEVTPVEYVSGRDAENLASSTSLVGFTLADAAGTLYRAHVQVATDKQGTSTVVSTPSLELVPDAAESDASAEYPWPGLSTDAAPEPVERAVQSWANAYVSGSSSALRLSVGDPSAESLYVPLTGVTSATATVSKVAPFPDERTLLARVDLAVLWAGRAAAATQDEQADLPTISFDVLVERADTASPVVTAWGPPGSGPDLQRYGNAVPAADRAPEQGATPTPIAAPDGTGSATPAAPAKPAPAKPAAPAATPKK